MEKREFPLSGLVRELKEELPDCKFDDITYLSNLKHLGTLIYFFKGNINNSENYINKKLTEGQKAKYFSIDELNNIRIVPLIRDFIYQHIDLIF